MAHLTLRAARQEDAGGVAEIHVAAWRAAYRGLMPEDYLAAQSVEGRTKMWHDALGRPSPAHLALAELEGTLAGFCIYGPTRDNEPPEVAEIYAVNVHPQYWRRGAGRLLCEHALREAAAREHRAMTLWVMTGNEPARRFYERLGYAPDGTQRTNRELIGRPFDELRYRKPIA
jgi:ribosomal protein S18 acetylase RimI-like enzyme